jgi:hypothetical protein
MTFFISLFLTCFFILFYNNLVFLDNAGVTTAGNPNNCEKSGQNDAYLIFDYIANLHENVLFLVCCIISFLVFLAFVILQHIYFKDEEFFRNNSTVGPDDKLPFSWIVFAVVAFIILGPIMILFYNECKFNFPSGLGHMSNTYYPPNANNYSSLTKLNQDLHKYLLTSRTNNFKFFFEYPSHEWSMFKTSNDLLGQKALNIINAPQEQPACVGEIAVNKSLPVLDRKSLIMDDATHARMCAELASEKIVGFPADELSGTGPLPTLTPDIKDVVTSPQLNLPLNNTDMLSTNQTISNTADNTPIIRAYELHSKLAKFYTTTGPDLSVSMTTSNVCTNLDAFIDHKRVSIDCSQYWFNITRPTSALVGNLEFNPTNVVPVESFKSDLAQQVLEPNMVPHSRGGQHIMPQSGRNVQFPENLIAEQGPQQNGVSRSSLRVSFNANRILEQDNILVHQQCIRINQLESTRVINFWENPPREAVAEYEVLTSRQGYMQFNEYRRSFSRNLWPNAPRYEQLLREQIAIKYLGEAFEIVQGGSSAADTLSKEL